MPLTNKTWGAGLLAIALASNAPALAQEVDADTVIATVGGAEITVGHMIVARQSLPPQYAQLEAGVLWEGLLDQLIQQNAMAQSLGDNVTRATELSIDNAVSGLLAGEALGKAIEAAVTEEALQAAYAAKYENAEPSREFRAAHILVETEEEATALVEDLAGGADFAVLAQEKSIGPSGPNGGDLGWFGMGMMVPAFEEAVIALDAGQVSEPVQTQFGWHVIQLNETRLADAPSLEEVQADLAAELEGAAVDTAVREVLEQTDVTRAEVEVDPAILNDLGLVVQ